MNVNCFIFKVWDDEIAVMAQTHAQQCEFKHDDCRNVG